MQRYTYDGPVMEFDRCIDSHWKGTTVAASKAKAKSNLIYQFKKATNRMPSCKIRLTGEVVPAN